MRMSQGQARLLRRTDPAFQTLNKVFVEFSTPRGGKASIRLSDYLTISSARRRRGNGELEGARPGLGPLRRFHAARSIPPANVWRPRRGDMSVERIEIGSEPPVRGVLHPVGARRADGLVLTHGAGGNAEGPLLVAVAEAFVSRGVAVLRWDLPFRQARPRGAPPPGGAEGDREGARA